MEVEMLCLANSRKHNGRCVAGLLTDGGGWIRPVGLTDDGFLAPLQYRCATGEDAAPLDLVRLVLHSARPKPYHPEDHVVDGHPWTMIRRPASAQTAIPLLLPHVSAGPKLLGNLGGRIAPELVAAGSLTLAAPELVQWYVRTGWRGNLQVRARFNLAGAAYDLSVTDPVWERYLLQKPPGEYTANDVGLNEADRLLLTVSLTEPFEGNCFKVVASAIALPPEYQAMLSTSPPAA